MSSYSERGESGERMHADAVLLALADGQRRHVLDYFRTEGTEVASLDELAAGVAAATGSDDPTELKRRYHHATLPKLDDIGVVEYDRETKTVTYVASPVLEEILSFVAGRAGDETSHFGNG